MAWQTWLRQARNDLQVADANLADGFTEWAGYCAQQAAEKALKALLLAADQETPYSHDLVGLWILCRDVGLLPHRGEVWMDDLQVLTTMSIEARYPRLRDAGQGTPREMIGREQAQHATDVARRVVVQVGERLADLNDTTTG